MSAPANPAWMTWTLEGAERAYFRGCLAKKDWHAFVSWWVQETNAIAKSRGAK
jgi:hypothetical protein